MVLVFIISCQVSEKPSSGPQIAQIERSKRAAINTAGLPINKATEVVNFVKISGFSLTSLCRL